MLGSTDTTLTGELQHYQLLVLCRGWKTGSLLRSPDTSQRGNQRITCMWQARWKIKSLHGSTTLPGGRNRSKDTLSHGIGWGYVEYQHLVWPHWNHGMCVHVCVAFPLMSGWSTMDYFPKGFLLSDYTFPSLLATGERFLLEIIIPLPFGHSRSANSVAPDLDL